MSNSNKPPDSVPRLIKIGDEPGDGPMEVVHALMTGVGPLAPEGVPSEWSKAADAAAAERGPSLEALAALRDLLEKNPGIAKELQGREMPGPGHIPLDLDQHPGR